MAIEVRPIDPGNRKERDAFLKVPFDIYKFDHNWTAPLFMEQRDLIQPEKNPWFEHGEAQFFMAYEGDEPVGRISAQVDHLHIERHDNAGFFGFFECHNDRKAAKALLQAAEAWVAKKDCELIRGPFSLSINEYAGLLIEGWQNPPMIMMGHNPPYYAELIEKNGYQKAKDLLAWQYDILKPVPKMSLPIWEKVKEHPGLEMRSLDMKNLERDVNVMLEIFNEAWEKNWGYVPMTESEIDKMVKDLKMIAEPEAIVIAEVDGEPAGLCLCLPNINEAIYGLDGKLVPFGFLRFLWRLKVRGLKTIRLVLLGVRKKYRGSSLGGLSIALYVEAHRRTKKLGYEMGELSWTLEDNVKINKGIEFMGGKVYKTYRVYEKPIERASA